MKVERYIAEVKAHGEAAERFADALKASFPNLAEQITKDKAIAFRGTLSGNDVFCTIETVTKEEEQRSAKYSRHYDPTNPEVRARRERLFAAIQANHTPESAMALRELTKAYSGTQ
jgi:hypothetical protein